MERHGKHAHCMHFFVWNRDFIFVFLRCCETWKWKNLLVCFSSSRLPYIFFIIICCLKQKKDIFIFYLQKWHDDEAYCVFILSILSRECFFLAKINACFFCWGKSIKKNNKQNHIFFLLQIYVLKCLIVVACFYLVTWKLHRVKNIYCQFPFKMSLESSRYIFCFSFFLLSFSCCYLFCFFFQGQ